MRQLILALFLLAGSLSGSAQTVNPHVKKVHVIFKTHLDIGFTDLSSKVEQRYIDEFIPKAIAVAKQLRAEGGEPRYVWTTGSWLVDAYLKQASPEAARQLEEAIRCGDVVWNGVPYTVESEAMNKELFAGTLKLSQQLDARFGKQTIAAKMTDVPGHTRSIVPLLCDAGIRFLQIGVNSAATVPDVPPVCRWRDPSGKEILLMYQKSYGEDMILPDTKTAVSINFTNDNKGPHTVQRVKAIYAELKRRYPSATIVASSLNAVATDLEAMRGLLPVLTSEIGDTWIYGYGSSPRRMAQFRALSRLYAHWIQDGQLDPNSSESIDFAIRLGMIGEHTWGADVKVFLKNWDKYDFDDFTAARHQAPFLYMEHSWKELDDNIDKAIALLPSALQQQAQQTVLDCDVVDYQQIVSYDKARNTDNQGRYHFSHKALKCCLGGVAYHSFSSEDYDLFQQAYLTRKVKWALEDNGKPGLEASSAQRAVVEAQMQGCSVQKDRSGQKIRCELQFPSDARIDSRVLPEAMQTQYDIAPNGRRIDITLSMLRKSANRLPEAYWFSFLPEQLTGVVAQKVGSRVDLLDVVAGGNRQMHGIDSYVDLITAHGTLRITSLDAPLLVVGARNALNYSTQQPDLSRGVHFCLYNNLWGTNFSMWWEGSITYRFCLEIL
ncbi:MAG: DUF5054 domain-containing protein [Alistipes sp.]